MEKRSGFYKIGNFYPVTDIWVTCPWSLISHSNYKKVELQSIETTKYACASIKLSPSLQAIIPEGLWTHSTIRALQADSGSVKLQSNVLMLMYSSLNSNLILCLLGVVHGRSLMAPMPMLWLWALPVHRVLISSGLGNGLWFQLYIDDCSKCSSLWLEIFSRDISCRL